jgi:hypothetical protein
VFGRLKCYCVWQIGTFWNVCHIATSGYVFHTAMWGNVRRIATIRKYVTHCNVCLCFSYCDDMPMSVTMWLHFMFIKLRHYYIYFIATLLCLSNCNITMFVSVWHYSVRYISTLICSYVYVHHIETLLCLVDFNVTMFDTLWCFKKKFTLQRQGDVQHITTSIFECHIATLISTLRQHVYVCDILASVYVDHIVTLLCSNDWDVTIFITF